MADAQPPPAAGLAEAQADLYQVAPETFVARRKELATNAKAAGDKDLAKAITALRRPTRVAWLINLLAHRRPEAITALLALGDDLADAQRRMAGDDLRRLSAQRRTMIDTLAREVVDLGRGESYVAPEGARQEISQTLQAGLSDRAVADELRTGTLTQTVVYGGFGTDDLAAALAASTTAAQAKIAATPDQAETSDQQADAADEAVDEATPEPAEDPAVVAERERLTALADEAQRAAEEAEGEADAATARADELADRVERLRADLRVSEAEEREAREAARAARKRYTQLRQAAAQAAAAAER